MPKRPHNRPAKNKTRGRRPAAARPVEAMPAGESVVAPAPAAASTTAATATLRRPTAMRVPTISVNYAYLRHDLRTLAVLAPTMVLVLVVAYFVLH